MICVTSIMLKDEYGKCLINLRMKAGDRMYLDHLCSPWILLVHLFSGNIINKAAVNMQANGLQWEH